MSSISPKYLPQIKIPIDYVLSELNKLDVNVTYDKIDANDLTPSQLFVISTDLRNAVNDENNPIWVDVDNKIIDGHHKWVNAIQRDLPVIIIRVNNDFNNSCRILNRICDIYEYDRLRNGLEEVVVQDVINQPDDELGKIIENPEMLGEIDKNPITLFGYRKDSVKNSKNGNFFLLEPISGFQKYKIEFDNLFDLEGVGIAYKSDQNPVDILATLWFPNLNFKLLAEKYDTTDFNLKSRIIVDRAKSLGYDGIKLNKIVWGLK